MPEAVEGKKMGYRQDWMTDDQWHCTNLLADLHKGFHHLPGKIKAFGYGVEINTHRCMATTDFDELTRLVFLCHDRCVRAEIRSSGPRMVKICLWRRHKTDGAMMERHPTLLTAVANWRKTHKQ